MSKVHQVHAPATPAGATVPLLAPDSALEHEAERMADLIGAAPAPAVADAGTTRAQGRLAPALQSEMQGHFDHDFSQVRVHADDSAARAAAGLGAAAQRGRRRRLLDEARRSGDRQ